MVRISGQARKKEQYKAIDILIENLLEDRVRGMYGEDTALAGRKGAAKCVACVARQADHLTQSRRDMICIFCDPW